MLPVRMQFGNESTHFFHGVSVSVIREVPIKVIDVDVVPHCFQWDPRITVAIDNRLKDGDVFILRRQSVMMKG